MNGTAADDGNSLEAFSVTWIFKVTPPVDFEHFPWFPFSDQVSGVRRALASCGNGQLDEGELCDDGSANGANDCCSSTCSFVDVDRDGVCNAVDDCPTLYDTAQQCAVPLEVIAAHADSNGNARLHGTIFHRIGFFSEVIVKVGSTARTYVSAYCSGDPSNYVKVRCRDADGLFTLIARRSTPLEDWRFNVRVKGLAIDGPPESPLAIEIVDRSNTRIGSGAAANCRLRRGRLHCRPQTSVRRREVAER
jgi:cysteine-rich repeat protein